MLTLQADPIPIRVDADGTLRVGQTRVLLELVINAFDNGLSPETIVQNFSSLRLPDVYAVIAHYLNHRDQVVEYLEQREKRAGEVAVEIAAHQRDLSEIRKRLLAQRLRSEPESSATGG